MDRFYAGTLSEIMARQRRKMYRFHLKYVMPHEGQLSISKKGIVFEGWRTITWDMIKNIKFENDEVLSSKMFATQSRLFFMKSAKPIQLFLSTGEKIYFYVNWKFGTGLSSNKKVYSLIEQNMK